MEIVGLAVQPRPDVVTQVESFSEVLDVGRTGLLALGTDNCIEKLHARSQ